MADDATQTADSTEQPKTRRARAADDGLVEVTITKFGEGKVSTGIHVTGEGDIFAARGDKVRVSPDVVKQLEILGLAEAN